jgi:acyl-CoA synthetase (NDP forming)
MANENAPVEAQALRRLLKPRSVAVIGASSTPGALGASVIENLDRANFPGQIHLVNPKRDAIGDRPCLKSVGDLPPGVDVALLAIPKVAVVETLRSLAAAKVGAAIIFSAGFAEEGPAGAQDQKEIARLAAASGMVIEGPNCLGLVNYVDRIPLTFIHTSNPALGDLPGIGVVSQSGAMAAVLSTMLRSRELGISYSVSTGNEAQTGVEDYVQFLLDDAHTFVIGMIVEHFRQPRRFLQLAALAQKKGKRIVVLHPGRSAAARASAATHTGALVGDYLVMRTLVEHHGVIVAENLEELGDLLEIAVRCPRTPSGGALVVAESGAYKALALDLCEQLSLDLPQLDNHNAPALRAAMPPFVPVTNPIDLTAQALADRDMYRRVLEAAALDERFGAIVLDIIQTDPATCHLKFPVILSAIEKLQRDSLRHAPILVAGVDEGAAIPAEYVARLRVLRTPYFPSPDRALRAVARFSHQAARRPALSPALPTPLGVHVPAGAVAEHHAKSLLKPLDFPFPPGRLATTLDDAFLAAAEIGFPIALKAQSAELIHKTDAGGVALNVKTRDDLARSWSQLQGNVNSHRPGLTLDGVLIEKMAPPGVELILGARQDPEWGPVILVGLGGVQAELFRDVRLLPADLDANGVVAELQRLKSAPLLHGFRGAPHADVDAIAALVVRLGQLMRGEPSILEMDLNPVIVYPKGQGVLAVDAVMTVGHSA